MLHTEFRANRSSGSGEDNHESALRLSLSCDPDATKKISFPLPLETPYKIGFCWPSGYGEKDV